MGKREQKTRRQCAIERACKDFGLETGSYLVNSLNRLCALSERLFDAENNEMLYNSNYCSRLAKRQENWVKRLNKILAQNNLELAFYGIYPTVVEKATRKSRDYIYY